MQRKYSTTIKKLKKSGQESKFHPDRVVFYEMLIYANNQTQINSS